MSLGYILKSFRYLHNAAGKGQFTLNCFLFEWICRFNVDVQNIKQHRKDLNILSKGCASKGCASIPTFIQLIPRTKDEKGANVTFS